MIKLVLKGIAVVLVVAVGTLLFLYLSRTDPWGVVPGKRLLGEEVTEPIEDWSFTEQARIVTLEVRPSAPYSVYTSCLFHDGVFYSLATSIENRWVQFLLQDPNVRFRVGREDNRLYQGRATVVEDPNLINDLFDTLAQKYRRGVDRTPEQRASYRFIRLGSR
jgi:hypothetical protein